MTSITMPTEVLEFYQGIQSREATIDDLDEEERVITLKAVPYGVEARIAPNLIESFEPAAFARAAAIPSRTKLWYGHSTDGGKIVGQAFEVRDVVDGPEPGVYLQTRVSKTEPGDELLTLVKDEVLDEASIEFSPMFDYMARSRRGEDYVVRHRRGHLRGVALVPAGAYGRHAVVTAVRDVTDKLVEEKLARLRLLNH